MIWFDFWHDLACLHQIGLPHWQVLLPCRKDQTSLFERQATGDTTDSPASRCLRTSRGFLTSWVFLFRADAEKASDVVNTVGFSTRWETAKRNKTDMPALFDRKHASMPAYTELVLRHHDVRRGVYGNEAGRSLLLRSKFATQRHVTCPSQ